MKKLIAILMMSALPLAYADCHAAATEKRVCVKEFDSKTKKEKEVCKKIKVHKKLEGTKIEDAKKK
jgi:hypothetical protein